MHDKYFRALRKLNAAREMYRSITYGRQNAKCIIKNGVCYENYEIKR